MHQLRPLVNRHPSSPKWRRSDLLRRLRLSREFVFEGLAAIFREKRLGVSLEPSAAALALCLPHAWHM